MKQVGRPTVMTDEVLQKLREAFLMGCSDEEACLSAQISPQTLYNYQKDNEDFSSEKASWKENPILEARVTVYKNLSNVETAKWYLERKKKDEFGQKSEVKLTGNMDLDYVKDTSEAA